MTLAISTIPAAPQSMETQLDLPQPVLASLRKDAHQHGMTLNQWAICILQAHLCSGYLLVKTACCGSSIHTPDQLIAQALIDYCEVVHG
jgi:hypothetical protein